MSSEFSSNSTSCRSSRALARLRHFSLVFQTSTLSGYLYVFLYLSSHIQSSCIGSNFQLYPTFLYLAVSIDIVLYYRMIKYIIVYTGRPNEKLGNNIVHVQKPEHCHFNLRAVVCIFNFHAMV